MTYKTNKITSKIQTMTVLTSVVVLIGISMVPNGFGHGTDTVQFSSGTKTVYYDSTAFASVKYDGSTGHATQVKTAAVNGMNDLHSLTDMTVTETTTYTSTTSKFSAQYYADTSIAGITTGILSNPPQHKHMFFNTNSNRDYSSGGTCEWYQNPNIEFIANHEFGHFAGLEYDHHSSTTESHTLNDVSCNSSWAILTSSDISQINGWY